MGRLSAGSVPALGCAATSGRATVGGRRIQAFDGLFDRIADKDADVNGGGSRHGRQLR
ncbi:MAG: hypothetical protein LC775_04415 [Acidobacteria bacterium]|nr:hypothetical protein [Acidobacteriota bacterium]